MPTIAEINGVTWASVAEVNGIAVASIAQINGMDKPAGGGLPAEDGVLRSPTNMTGYTSGAITVSVSQSYGQSWTDAYAGWRAFNGNYSDNNDLWITEGGAFPQWIKIDFGADRTIYTVKTLGRPAVSDNRDSPRDFKVQYSSDNSTWSDAYEKTGETAYASGTLKTHDLTTPATARYWRVYVTDNQGAGTYLGMVGLEFYS